MGGLNQIATEEELRELPPFNPPSIRCPDEAVWLLARTESPADLPME